MTTEDQTIADDLLKGACKISKFTGLPVRQIYDLANKRKIPTFKIGGFICGRKSTLLEWFSKLEST